MAKSTLNMTLSVPIFGEAQSVAALFMRLLVVRSWDTNEVGELLTSLSEILTVRGSLNDFLHNRDLSMDPGCSYSAPREDAIHLLLKCVVYEDFRDLQGMEVIRVDDECCLAQVSNSPESIRAGVCH